VAETILNAGLLALEDFASGVPQYRVVSAPTGSGKSSYAFALIKALIDAIDGSSAVFLCETVDQCEDTYRDLVKLLGSGELAIWTTSHDKKRTLVEVEAKEGFRPSVQFLVDDLDRYRVVVVTHAFYRGTRGSLARLYAGKHRTLTIVDERPKEVSLYDIDQGDVLKARDWAAGQYGSNSAAVEAFRDLHACLDGAWETESNTSFRILQWVGSSWFRSNQAHRVLTESSDSNPGQVIGFAQALDQGYAFMSRFERGAKGGRFVGYKMDLPVFPGTVFLDATSDIDGVSELVSWRITVASPQVSYENLAITHITPPLDVLGSGERITEIVRHPERAKAYASWIRETVVKNTSPGEKVLVVVHKAMLAGSHLPNQDSLGEDAYDLDGRKVAFINWGYGIGSNRWKSATSVFLFGEYYIPKRTIMGQMLGLLDQPVSEYRLTTLQSPNSVDEDLLRLRHGHLLRWEKQLAMRGNARNMTPQGACGEQRLFITSDFRRFFPYVQILFPGAKFKIEDVPQVIGQGAEALARVLLTCTDRPCLTSREIQREVGLNVGKRSRRLLQHPLVQHALIAGGWVYVAGGGRGNPSRFERNGAVQHRSETTASGDQVVM
jgi:hypothetical protein